MNLCKSISSHLSPAELTRYLAVERTKWCPANEKIAWMNRWINAGGVIPNKNDYANMENSIPALIRENRARFWNTFSQSPSGIGNITKLAVEAAEREKSLTRSAIDLGGGNSTLATWLLSKGWKVTVVDSSPAALQNLQTRTHAQLGPSITNNNLTLECQAVEDYKFPKNISLITAQNFLPYCDPSKIELLWNKIYDSLEPNGRITGNFFHYPLDEPDKILELQFRLRLGVWLLDNPLIAESLLKNAGYKIEVLKLDDYKSTPGLDFTGHKSLTSL